MTVPALVDLKSALRSRLRTVLTQIPVEEMRALSLRACAVLQAQPVWMKAASVLFYAQWKLELDLSPLIRAAIGAGKTVALPRFIAETGCYAAFEVTNPWESLAPGKFGIPEPPPNASCIPFNQLDLVLVPGIAFDTGGRRLGRGRGFYDRLLAAVPGAKCGAAFDEQIVNEIPVEPHDVLMNFILTPSRWLRCGSREA